MREREREIQCTGQNNWPGIKTVQDFGQTSMASGDERLCKLGSCSDIMASSCHFNTLLPTISERDLVHRLGLWGGVLVTGANAKQIGPWNEKCDCVCIAFAWGI